MHNGLNLPAGRATLTASLPWHRLEASDDVGGGGLLGLPVIVDPTQPTARTRRDRRFAARRLLCAAAGRRLRPQPRRPGEAADRVAPPRHRTGKTDFSLGGELCRTFGAVTPFVSAAYTLPGDPEGYELCNALSARGGVAMQFAPRRARQCQLWLYTEREPLVPDEQQISTGLNASLSRSLSLGLYGSAGLSEGSPDVGAGVSLGIRLF